MDGRSSCVLEVTWTSCRVQHALVAVSHSFTFLTVGLALLHVEGLVPDGILAGRTLETLNMVGHLQRVHDFLKKKKNNKKNPQRISHMLSSSAAA